MIIVCPVDVKYKGETKKAHTKFNCDSSDFERFRSLGAWAYKTETKDVKAKKNLGAL